MRKSFQLKTLFGWWRATWPAFRSAIPFFFGYAAGWGLGVLPGIPLMTDGGRTFTLFLFGAVNGWMLCMLWGAVTGKAKRKRKRKGKERRR